MIKKFKNNYLKQLFNSLNMLDETEFEKACIEIEKKIKAKKTIFVCGNGGSLSIANHLVCDFSKTIKEETQLNPKVISLVAFNELISAISNDKDFSEALVYQASSLVSKEDLVILISSSGNSPNMKKLINYCKKNKFKTITITGFRGGYIKNNADIKLHVNTKNYGIAEDCAQVVMHMITQFIAIKNSNAKNKKT